MADAKPDAKPDAKLDAKPDAKPDVKPDAKPAPARAAGGAKRAKKIVEAEGIAHVTATFNSDCLELADCVVHLTRHGTAGGHVGDFNDARLGRLGGTIRQ